ncbi:MAG: Holliday junction resolvase RuvX [Acidimicrobiia bacterium]|nr:Holliday junction resolvase RuvX [Acidimicrobiia bacterium]
MPGTPRNGGRAIGLDLGDRRIGVAVCDAGRTVATPSEIVQRVGDRPVEHDLIAEIVDRTEATVVVVGLPLSLDGSVGPAARKVLSEVKALRRRLGPGGVEVVTHDERNTTTTAANSLADAGIGSRKGRGVVDQVAAAVILQSWIDANRS